MKEVCGIDVSKSSLEVFWSGKTSSFTNSLQGFRELLVWTTGAELYVMEATGSYHLALAEYLYHQNIEVAVVNPAQSSHYARALGLRHKTDRSDCEVLAVYAQRTPVPRFTPLSPEHKELRNLMRRREDLIRRKVQLDNQLQDPGIDQRIIQSIKAEQAFLKESLKTIMLQVKQLLKQEPLLQRQQQWLKSIPGVGETLTLTLLAEIDWCRFQSGAQLAAYVGVCPREKSSGTSLHAKPRMSKQGHAALRKALYMPALAAIRTCSLFKNFSLRLLGKGKTKMQAIGAVMHKLLRIAFGVIKNQTPFDPLWGLKT